MQSLPQPSAPSQPTHSRNSSAGNIELTQDLNLRVLIAHSAAAAAASSAPGSPNGTRTPANPFAGPDAQPAKPVVAAKADKASAVSPDAAIEDGLPHASDQEASDEQKQLLNSASGSEQEPQHGMQRGPAADSGHLTAQGSANSSMGVSSSATANGSSVDTGHLLSSPALSGPVWERAHSAPPMPRLEDLGGSPTSHPVRSESLLSLLGDGAESVLSAPGNVETPKAAVEAALAAEPHPRPLPRTASASAADDRGRFSQSAGSLVSRYVAMFEARQPVISMPSWQRQELRGRSTDLVLRFLNRQRRPRGRARSAAAASPEDGPGRAAAPAQHHHSDSDEHSGSEDEHEDGKGNASDEDGSTGLRTPPRRHSSPLRGRSPGSCSSTGSPSGTPLHPSRLGDARRATTAENVRPTHSPH